MWVRGEKSVSFQKFVSSNKTPLADRVKGRAHEEKHDGPTEGIEVLSISEPNQRKIPSKIWRECIKKVWEVAPLECPNAVLR